MALLKSNPAPTFLTLPLELRLEIYSLLAHQSYHPPKAVSTPIGPLPYVIAAPFYASQNINPQQWKCYMSPYRPTMVLCTLRAVNRQLRNELRGVVAFYDLALEVTADFRAKNGEGMVDGVLKAVSQDVLRENVVAVGLYYQCMAKGLACRHNTKDYSTYSPKWKQNPFDNIVSGSDRLYSRLWPPPSIPRASFQSAILALEKLESLKYLHVSFSHGDVLDWFESSVEETLEVFVPFLRRGVQVSLGSNSFFDRAGKHVDPCAKMTVLLKKGDGILDVNFPHGPLGRGLILKK